MTPALTSAVVAYLGLVTVLAAAAALSAPVGTAARTGDVVGRVCVLVVVVADLVSLVRGHRPAELATHLCYSATAVALPFVLVRGGEETPYALLALSSAVVAVVLVRLAQTWA